MIQEIIVWVIVAACLAAAVTAIVRRFRHRRPACNCNGKDCAGCAKRNGL